MQIAARGIWNGSGEPRPGRVTIAGGRIDQILPPGPAQIDLGDCLLCAGFVNAHVHLDLSLPRPTDRLEGSFDEWLKSVVETRRALGDDGITMAATLGAEEALASGTTALFDIDPAGHSILALIHSPLRRLILREVIALQSQPGPDLETLTTFLQGSPDTSHELRGISPHSSYTVHPQVLAQLLPFCRQHGAPWTMHVAEPEWERELLVEGSGEGAKFLEGFGADPTEFQRGETMIDSLSHSQDLTSNGLIIHGNQCRDDELATMAKSGSALVWCPRSHQFFGRAPHPAPRAVEAGVPVLLGTDAKVSAGNLSMLEELRCAAATAPELQAEVIWQMATVNPRQWLAAAGYPELLGSGTLKVGDPADLVAVSIPDHDGPLLQRALEGQVIASWIGGRALQPEPIQEGQ